MTTLDTESYLSKVLVLSRREGVAVWRGERSRERCCIDDYLSTFMSRRTICCRKIPFTKQQAVDVVSTVVYRCTVDSLKQRHDGPLPVVGLRKYQRSGSVENLVISE